MFKNLTEDLNQQMRYKIKKDWRNRLVIIAFDNGFQATALFRLANWLQKKGLRAAAYLVNRLSVFFTGTDISPTTTIGPGLIIGHGVGLVVGGGTRIGRHVLLMQGVTLGARELDPEGDISMPSIGDHAVICAGAKVLGPITVGAHALVAANCVLLDSVPAGSVVAGIPGLVVANRPIPDNLDRETP